MLNGNGALWINAVLGAIVISHKLYVNIQADNLTNAFVNLNEKVYIQNFKIFKS